MLHTFERFQIRLTAAVLEFAAATTPSQIDETYILGDVHPRLNYVSVQVGKTTGIQVIVVPAAPGGTVTMSVELAGVLFNDIRELVERNHFTIPSIAQIVIIICLSQSISYCL